MVWVGWSGFLLYVLSQAGLALVLISASRYILLNCAASLLVAIYSLYIGSLQPFFISTVWSITSLVALAKQLPEEHEQENAFRFYAHLGVLLFGSIFVVASLSIHLDQDWKQMLAWQSLATYSLAYLSFIFLRLDRRRYFLLCALAAALVIPELHATHNYPTLMLHSAWGLTSLIGFLKIVLADEKQT